MKKIKHNKKEYTVAKEVYISNEELIELILNSESLEKKEKQQWFDDLLEMKKTDIKKLKNIFQIEYNQYKELESYNNNFEADLDISHNETDFIISKKLQEKKTKLVNLILMTDSMGNKEKQQWFNDI